MEQPLIGITCNYETPDRVGILTDMGVKGQSWEYLAANYAAAVQQAGGIPVYLPTCRSSQTTHALVRRLDGVIFSGGHDVSPSYYGEAASEQCGVLSSERDKGELELAQYLLQQTDLPILGICRGMQVLNVALGGSLFQDVQTSGFQNHSWDDSPMNQPVHPVKLQPESWLAKTVKAQQLEVNSYHHSAVKQLGQGLQATAFSPDGLVEAVELSAQRFAAAVQWHPEMMYDSSWQQSLFSAFIKSCANRMVK
ncbi:MAG: gamma-glutamyl-gamma-aminobutyrate hydrolase family protein [Pygmaiobacter massiliensis]|nr:gamma-glutamyl-gamma-aminobutyrate hydrolase family protein [Pygmaiobacter massiliensis]